MKFFTTKSDKSSVIGGSPSKEKSANKTANNPWLANRSRVTEKEKEPQERNQGSPSKSPQKGEEKGGSDLMYNVNLLGTLYH